MFLDAYQHELAALHTLGQAFGKRHPALAGMLAGRASDPDVERLLEGFAFVAARLRARIDHAAPALIEGLAELLFPHLLRPTPAATIVAFQAAPRALRGPRRLARGTRLLARAIDGTRCTFTTTRDLVLLPLRLIETQLDDAHEAAPALHLRFEAEPGAEACAFTKAGIRLHLHGEPAVASQLYLWLTQHVTSVTVRAESGRALTLGPQVVRSVGLDHDDTLLPWPSLAPQGTRLFQELFTLPEKFLFVDLTQLDRARDLACGRFDVTIRFARPPRLPGRLAADAVQLHCTPAVNVFDADAEPVRVQAGAHATLLRAAGMVPSHMEVFEVHSVEGAGMRAEPTTIAPHHAFGMNPACAQDTAYRLERRISPIDDGIDTFLTLQTPASAPVPRTATLSVALRCTNRSLARGLVRGDLATPTTDVGAGVSFTNITNVTPPGRPPLGEPLLWHFVALLGCTRRSLADAAVLKRLLALHLPRERATQPTGRAQRAHIEAVTALRADTATRILDGLVACGTHYRLTLDGDGFASVGEAYLFSLLLHRLLALDARINGFADLTVLWSPAAPAFEFVAGPMR